MSATIDNNLKELGIELPTPAAPAANYIPYTIAGNILIISGQIPMGPNGIEFVGKLGDDMDVAGGQGAARLCAINILAQAKAARLNLNRRTCQNLARSRQIRRSLRAASLVE